MLKTMASYRSILPLLLLAVVVGGASANSEGEVRLVNGETTNCGRVEVYHAGEWGTVCDDRWNSVAGNTICKHLGYSSATTVYSSAHFGQGEGEIWIDSIRCSEDASSLAQCQHNEWGRHDCSHREDAGVCCKRETVSKPETLSVRIRCPECTDGGSQPCKQCPGKRHPSPNDCLPQIAVRGIVEVKVDGQWGMVSADDWGVDEATVVCGELGYPMAYPYGHSPPSVGEVWPEYVSGASATAQCSAESRAETVALHSRLPQTSLQGVECSGKESKLLDCYISGFGPQPNPSREVATVQCGFFPHIQCYSSMSEGYRLKGGAVPWKGRLELRRQEEWGTICDTGFDDVEANIVCRNLGYGTVKAIKGRAGYGRGIGKIHFTQLRCSGSEMRLSSCEHQTDRNAQACGHEGDVGVECNIPDMTSCNKQPELYHVRMHKTVDSLNPTLTRTYPEVQGNMGWGLLCFSETSPLVTLLAGEVICRQTESLFLSAVSQGSLPSGYQGSVFYTGEIVCTGDEEALSDCTINISPSTCSEYTIVDCTSTVPDLVPDVYRFKRSLEARFWVDRIPIYYLECAKEEGCLSSSANNASTSDTRYLFRFDSLTMNYGLHDFLPLLAKEDWIWHSCHNHYHSMEAFVQYDLLNVDTGEQVAEGHKASFCLEDSTCARNSNRHFQCYLGVQGISVNCGDLYGNYLDCQWIDITGVPGGEYILRQTVNPQRLVVESDYKNNEISCHISLSDRGYSYTTGDCWISDHEGTADKPY